MVHAYKPTAQLTGKERKILRGNFIAQDTSNLMTTYRRIEAPGTFTL